LDGLMPLSGKKMRSLFIAEGYEIIKGQGKGSHFKLKKKGCPTVTIPDHKELSIGLERGLLKTLEIMRGKS
jgi:predicted RNA binding protein YcfA (HicA-like mRNA interferase family)